ncbi:deoxyribodipyrimidine photo-lyase [Zobellella maritima]|uniref:deoxyribodipyrimidine photo-lyase n=1 Tax=Zobellella maritima TaxID=2059725 RepID=UPI000E306B95|nr:deoxyribodipyrimidine photo-lyase [Zobellella maritima]
MRHLIWFRTDLRVADNPALHEASAEGAELQAVFIACPGQWRQHGMAAIQRDFLARNLMALSRELAALGIPFTLLEADTFTEVPGLLGSLVDEQGIDALYANLEIGINERRRDQAVQQALSVPVRLFNGDCVVSHGSLRPRSGDMYKVFTPFAKAWLAQVRASGYRLLPVPCSRGPALEVTPVELSDGQVSSEAWPVGERAASRQLTAFCHGQLREYGEQRDYPDAEGTSRLSPYLALGVLSPNQCLAAVEAELGYLPLSRGEQGFTWINELIWREFYRHLMVVYPRLSMNRPFKVETGALKWSNNHLSFELWCRGRTGYPLVDAAMRCLNETGWMHNRLRMVVASFLTKDLHIDWRWGEDYFMSRLIDGDLAANNGGWQWAAGTGADAAPYFRVFNPTTQSERFDADGRFIRRWLPELAAVPAKVIHAPHEWLTRHGMAQAYPPPVVDHARSRLHAIAMFDALKDRQEAP